MVWDTLSPFLLQCNCNGGRGRASALPPSCESLGIAKPSPREDKDTHSPPRSPGKAALTLTKCAFCSNFCYKPEADCPSPPVGQRMIPTCRMGSSFINCPCPEPLLGCSIFQRSPGSC